VYAGDELFFYIVDGGYVLATRVPVTNAFDERKTKLKKKTMQLTNLPVGAIQVQLQVQPVLVNWP